MLRKSLLVLALVSAGAAAEADPPDAHGVVVFAPIREGDNDRRIQVANAVYQVLTVEGHLADLSSGIETFHHLHDYPQLQTCSDGACAARIAERLNARGVVMVQFFEGEGRHHTEAHVAIEVFSQSGAHHPLIGDSQVIARSPAGGTRDAVALAVAFTRTNLAYLLTEINRLVPPPTPTPASTPGDAHPEPEPDTHAGPGREHPEVAALPPATVTVYHRRTGEAVAGTLLLLGGAAAVAVGVVDLASYGTVADDPAMTSLRRPLWAPQDWLLFGAGGAALVAGTVLLIDGVQRRGEEVPARAPAVGITPLARGAALTLSGRF